MNRIKTFAYILLFSAFAENIVANVKLASPFGDHMVLQRNKIVPIWGTATPGEKVIIDFNKQQKSTIAGSDGSWSINLNKLKAGGPFILTAKGENTITLLDVYIGEVWICSGQSNMDFTVARENRYWCGVFNEKQEVAEANYPLIRVFDTDFSPREELQKEVAGNWEIVSPQTVGHISAVAYFFARDLQIYVQLANIGKEIETEPAKGGTEAIKREAQLFNLSIPKTAMVVAIDNADPLDMKNVHPKNKQEIGKRMVLAALAIAYGEKLTYSGPVYDKMEIIGNTIQLQFKSTDKGLICKGDQLKGFAIAGEDKKFVWADAKIVGNTILVSSPDIIKPVAVRYGWGSNPPISLYNKADLPASPFRTDVGNN